MQTHVLCSTKESEWTCKQGYTLLAGKFVSMKVKRSHFARNCGIKASECLVKQSNVLVSAHVLKCERGAQQMQGSFKWLHINCCDVHGEQRRPCLSWCEKSCSECGHSHNVYFQMMHPSEQWTVSVGRHGCHASWQTQINWQEHLVVQACRLVW